MVMKDVTQSQPISPFTKTRKMRIWNVTPNFLCLQNKRLYDSTNKATRKRNESFWAIVIMHQMILHIVQQLER